ncbi:hypothetical protein AC578_6385 [Pseudocercospora eumusae]|uniref:Uncharacterized protein n=1 Tax=Pseudocercospora eumusae TaxID=321146 RepID=A0A139H0S4_9PEZI|nr:hypothetical protein AC578_6385 [Pseudocercospora eumusae]
MTADRPMLIRPVCGCSSTKSTVTFRISELQPLKPKTSLARLMTLSAARHYDGDIRSLWAAGIVWEGDGDSVDGWC